MSNYTPGPWKACNDGDCGCGFVSANGHPICQVTSGDWGDEYPSIRLVGNGTLDSRAEAYIDKVVYGHVAPDTAKANASLIAAAPDLLEALKELFNPQYWNDQYGRYDYPLEASQAARAAIAKAEGRS